jgi:hypothetical protein
MRRNAIVPLAALSLVVLAGCGGGADTSQQSSGAAGTESNARTKVSAAEAKRHEMERLIADCMKKEGFQYIPDLRTMDGEDNATRFGGETSVLVPADEVRTFRQKYGFGAFARLVFPNDPVLKQYVMDPTKPGPNTPIVNAMDPAKRKAYDLALHGTADGSEKIPDPGTTGCSGAAAEKVWPAGRNDTGKEQAANQRAYEKFQTDPAVVAAAQKYADCLRDKGYKVTSTQPGQVAMSLYMDALRAAERANPASAPIGESGAQPAGSAPITAEAAKEGLQKEIKAALADLDCRGDYAQIARTKYADAVANGGGAG